MRWRGRIVICALLAPVIGCHEQPDRPVPAGQGSELKKAAFGASDRCAQGGGRITDPQLEALLPRTLGGYCVDPNGEVRRYGSQGGLPLREACTELLASDCGGSAERALKSVASLRYVSGKDAARSVHLISTTFDSDDDAYAFFTARAPRFRDQKPSSVRVLDLPGAGCLADDRAFSWRGRHVMMLRYANETETSEQKHEQAQRTLPELAKRLSEGLPGEAKPPSAVGVLPTEHELPLSVRYVVRDALGISGAGRGAMANYAEGNRRWRAVALESIDEDACKDVVSTLKREPGYRKIKKPPHGEFRLMLDEEPQPGAVLERSEWLLTRVGRWIIGIGDDPFSVRLPEDVTPRAAAKEKRVSLGRAQKSAELGAWLRQPLPR